MISAPPAAVDIVLAPIVTAFLAQHPGVTIKITADSSLIDIVAAGCDAGIRFEETLGQDMVSVSLGDAAICRGRGSSAARGPRDSEVDQRTRRDAPPLGPLSERTQLLWEFARGGRKLKVAPQGPLISSHPPLLMKAASDGLGFLLAFEGYVTEAVTAGTLVRVLDEWNPSFPRPFLYYASRRHTPATLAAFVADAKALRKNPPSNP